MPTRKRTVITEETHEVWIIHRGDDANEAEPSTESSSEAVDFERVLALDPIDDEDE